MTVDHHTIAAIALTGTALNLLGGLYLAYDLPVRFSALAALGTGSTLGSLVRGACFGLGSAWLFGWRFGVSFGALSTIGQVVAYGSQPQRFAKRQRPEP